MQSFAGGLKMKNLEELSQRVRHILSAHPYPWAEVARHGVIVNAGRMIFEESYSLWFGRPHELLRVYVGERNAFVRYSNTRREQFVGVEITKKTGKVHVHVKIKTPAGEVEVSDMYNIEENVFPIDIIADSKIHAMICGSASR